MMAKLFETYEIGGLKRGGSRATAASSSPRRTSPRRRRGAEARNRLQVPHQAAQGTPQTSGGRSSTGRAYTLVKMFERLSLDYIYTGEQWLRRCMLTSRRT
jgi:hypothetical protein